MEYYERLEQSKPVRIRTARDRVETILRRMVRDLEFYERKIRSARRTSDISGSVEPFKRQVRNSVRMFGQSKDVAVRDAKGIMKGYRVSDRDAPEFQSLVALRISV